MYRRWRLFSGKMGVRYVSDFLCSSFCPGDWTLVMVPVTGVCMLKKECVNVFRKCWSTLTVRCWCQQWCRRTKICRSVHLTVPGVPKTAMFAQQRFLGGHFKTNESDVFEVYLNFKAPQVCMFTWPGSDLIIGFASLNWLFWCCNRLKDNRSTHVVFQFQE